MDANGGGVTRSQDVVAVSGRNIIFRPLIGPRWSSASWHKKLVAGCNKAAKGQSLFYHKKDSASSIERPRLRLGDLSERFDSLEVSLKISYKLTALNVPYAAAHHMDGQFLELLFYKNWRITDRSFRNVNSPTV